MNYAIVSAGLMALLLFALSFAVSMTRMRLKKGYGHDADASSWLTKLVRAQGNAAEYIPILMVMMLILEIRGSANWADWVYIIACVSRYVHALGMLLSRSLDFPHVLRFLGSVGTYVCGFCLAYLVIIAGL